MNKIAVLIPYFGKWPEWIDLYFYSCEKNSFIDWYFFSDCKLPEKSYNNLFFHSISFEIYCKRVSYRLGINFMPENPYKLCDLKPFYGFIHEDLLTGYEFWGFADVDVVWGNIRSFYSDTLLAKYNVFSTGCDRISGHFCLIKNTVRYTTLCFKINHWKSKLLASQNYALDEVDFSNVLLPENKFIRKFYTKILMRFLGWRNALVFYHSLMLVLNVLTCHRMRKLYFKEQHTTPILSDDDKTYKHDADEWYYINGKITNNKTNNEYIYMHFMILKKNNMRKDHYWKENFYHLPDHYDFSKGICISIKGFFKQ